MKRNVSSNRTLGIVLSSFVLLSFLTFSQEMEIKRSTTCSSGTSSTVNFGEVKLLVQQSIGQACVIGASYTTRMALRQGFIQPIDTAIPSINAFEEWKLNFTAFPNPFDNELNILFDQEIEPTKISVKIYDGSGKVHYFEEIQFAQLIKLNLVSNQLPPGFYFLSVSCGFKEKVIKLIHN